MKKITVEVRPEHAGGRYTECYSCLLAKAFNAAGVVHYGIGAATWTDSHNNKRPLHPVAYRLSEKYCDSEDDPTLRAALLASLPQSFELEVPDGQE